MAKLAHASGKTRTPRAMRFGLMANRRLPDLIAVAGGIDRLQQLAVVPFKITLPFLPARESFGQFAARPSCPSPRLLLWTAPQPPWLWQGRTPDLFCSPSAPR